MTQVKSELENNSQETLLAPSTFHLPPATLYQQLWVAAEAESVTTRSMTKTITPMTLEWVPHSHTCAAIHTHTPRNQKKDRDSDSGEWEVVKRGNKKQKRTNYPELSYSELHRLQASVKLGDLQGLVLYCLADGTSPQWVSLKHHNMVKKAVVLFLPGLEKGMFDGGLPVVETQEKSAQTEPMSEGESEAASNEDTEIANALANGIANKEKSTGFAPWSDVSPDDYLPTQLEAGKLPEPLKPLADVFSHVWPVRAPGDERWGKVHSPLQAMLQSPISKTQEEKRLEKEIKGPKPATGGKHFENKRTPITVYIMSNEDLQENEYVLHPANFTTKELENEFQRPSQGQARGRTMAG